MSAEDNNSLPKQPELHLSNLSLLNQTNANNLVNGVKKGFNNLILGTLAGVGVIFATPVIGGVAGYKGYGVGGAIAGSVVGGIVGAIGGTVVIVGGVVTCIWQIGYGIYRSPEAIYALANGKHWDEDAQEWVHYDLKIESENLSKITEEEFVRMVTEENKQVKAIYSQCMKEETSNHTTANQSNTVENSDETESTKRPKKDIQDRELYDVLGVEPEATTSEIKKAYYKKARENHPDRNPGNEEAKAKFQKIGQAYQILADEHLRYAYDTKGKSAVEGTNPMMDSTALYMMLFGSENFEPIIGELYIAMQVKLVSEEAKHPAVLQFRQRKRELKLAQILVEKLESFQEGDEPAFMEKCKKEATELAESSMGAALLGVIGRVYMNRANAHLSSISSLTVSTYNATMDIAKSWNYFMYGCASAWSALELRGLQRVAEAKQKEEDEKNNVTPEERAERDRRNAGPMGAGNLGPSLYGPNPTPEHKEKVRNTTKKFSGNVLALLWEMMKNDIEQTLKHVCKKVLRDRSASIATRNKRAEALLMLGSQYCTRTVVESQAVNDFLERMGTQSGLFGEGADTADGDTQYSPFAETNNETDTEVPTSKEKLDQDDLYAMISRVDNMSVKELRSNITLLGGNYTDCVEKSDLQTRLNALISQKLE